MGIPTLGMTCSHVGNEAFPRWGQSVPPKGIPPKDSVEHFVSISRTPCNHDSNTLKT